MLNFEEARQQLLAMLHRQSVFHGDFILASGAKSKVYVDCKLTTLDAQGAWLVGQTMHTLIRREAAARKNNIQAIGGLTMGADPIALAVGMYSAFSKDEVPFRVFSVRKAAKTHGQTKLVEGNFTKGDSVVVIEDVVTRGESSIAANEAVEKEGGTIAFVAALVNRQEGGSDKIQAMGHPVVSLFNRAELFGPASNS